MDERATASPHVHWTRPDETAEEKTPMIREGLIGVSGFDVVP
jgi:hypothetical protein